MKKIYFFLIACLAGLGTRAATYTVTASGTAYSPATLTVSVGDMIVFTGMAAGHPTAQVDASTWNANGTSTLSSGWGVKNTDFTITVNAAGTIYYVCQNHVSQGMKGQIIVNAAGVQEYANTLQNLAVYPNPVQTDARVSFSLAGAGHVSVKLYNLLGQEVSTIVQPATFAPGSYNFACNLPAGLSNGTYFVVTTTGDKTITRKLIVNR